MSEPQVSAPTPRKRAVAGGRPEDGNVTIEGQLAAIDAVLSEPYVDDASGRIDTDDVIPLPEPKTVTIPQPGPVILNPDIPKPSRPLASILSDDLRRRAIAATEPHWVYGNPYEAATVVRDLLELLRETTP